MRQLTMVLLAAFAATPVLIACGGDDGPAAAPSLPATAASSASAVGANASAQRAAQSATTGPNSFGDTSLTLSGGLVGALVLTANPACGSGGTSLMLKGKVGETAATLDVRSTTAGQNYGFPQGTASGTPTSVVVTLTAAGAPAKVWSAGTPDFPGKGTLGVGDAGGSLNLDVGSAATGTVHISGRWRC